MALLQIKLDMSVFYSEKQFILDWNNCFYKSRPIKEGDLPAENMALDGNKFQKVVEKYRLSPDGSKAISASPQDWELGGRITFESGKNCTYYY